MSRKSEHQVLKVTAIVLLAMLLTFLLSPFLISLFFASTLALAIHPLQLRLEKRGWSKKWASVTLTTALTLMILLPLSLFLVKGAFLITDQLQKYALEEKLKSQGVQSVLRSLKHSTLTSIQGFSEKHHLNFSLPVEKFNTYWNQTNDFLLDFFQGAVTRIPVACVYFFITVICTYAFLRNAERIRPFFQNLFGFTHRTMNEMVGVLKRDCRQIYVTNLITGGVQALVVGLGVTFVVGADFFLVFFVTFILAFIPVIGAAPVTFFFAVFSYLSGNTKGAIILACVGAFASVIDNILRPWLASFGESKTPAIACFICVLGGAFLLGFPGLFVGLFASYVVYDTLPLFWDDLGKPNLFESFGRSFERRESEGQDLHS